MASAHPVSIVNYYPYPSEINVRDYVPIKLVSPSNYPTWKMLMLRLMETHGLIGFIDGSFTIGNQATIQGYQAWRRSDLLLQSWIVGTISDDLISCLVRYDTARDLWAALDNIFVNMPAHLPAYPYPSEIEVRDFVPITLSRSNYSIWSKLMLRLIQAQGLYGFISGPVSAPSERMILEDPRLANGNIVIENEDFKAWQKSDTLLQSWIIGTIHEDFLAILESLRTAGAMWQRLKNFVEQFVVESETESQTNELKSYEPLYKAALEGNWESAKQFLQADTNAVRAIITEYEETAMIVAVRTAQRNQFVKNLLDWMSPEDLNLTNGGGVTALHRAAQTGNLLVAKWLVKKNPILPNRCDNLMRLPLYFAAWSAEREMCLYLLEVTNENIEPKPFVGEQGATLVATLIKSGLYDIALTLTRRYNLAHGSPSPLEALAGEPSAFPSGERFHWWQSIIYFYVPARFAEPSNGGGGVLRQKLHVLFWRVMAILVPEHIKNIQEKKVRHGHALELLKHSCEEIAKGDPARTPRTVLEAIKSATFSGIYEVIEEVLASFPGAIYQNNIILYKLFHLAVQKRNEDMFNLIYQFPEYLKKFYLSAQDEMGNNCLHLVAALGNEQKLKLRGDAAGAALQMQRELQWFKEVENLLKPQDRLEPNRLRKTPSMVFTETHEELAKEGEQWMKDTATSCTIVAALVVTVIFAAAITVPGGNHSDSGFPIFSRDPAFKTFGISNALALFTSTSSVLMFLSILTSRYAKQDFLLALPRKLILGLVTLFVSIISMMIAFGATFYLVFGDRKAWVLIIVIGMAFIPIAMFASLQFPLLFDLLRSTYFPGIFHKKRSRMLM